MPRQRWIHPELWSDPAVGRLDMMARLLFVGLFSLADDEGRIRADPWFLRSEIFRWDDLTVEDVRSARDRLAAQVRGVQLYTVDGEEYIVLRNWRRWQNPRYPKPSVLPPPPGTRHSDEAPGSDGALRRASSVGQSVADTQATAAGGQAEDQAASSQAFILNDSALRQVCDMSAASPPQDCRMGRDGMGREGRGVTPPNPPHSRGGAAPPVDNPARDQPRTPRPPRDGPRRGGLTAVQIAQLARSWESLEEGGP